MDSSFAVQGLDELNAAMQRLPEDVMKKLLRGGLRAAGKVLAAEVKQNVPVGAPNSENARLYGAQAGALRDSVRVSTKLRRDGSGAVSSVKIGVSKGNKAPYYAHFLEYGTKPHEIRPAGAKSLFLAGVFTEVVHHPGITKRPFMRPAIDKMASSESAPAIEAFKAYLAARITTEIAKLPDEADTEDEKV